MVEDKILVGILMGSDSDLKVMSQTIKVLEFFEIRHEIIITSAHKTLKKTIDYAQTAQDRGIEIIICGAGLSAALPGVVSSQTFLPVIGVPLSNEKSCLNGVDALYSIMQMPPGIPVATMSIGELGAKNAGLLTIQILALKYPVIYPELKKYRDRLTNELEGKNEKLNELGYEKYLEKHSK
ncbi:MAG: 5-(carboxyamino)imidazole ribonucleotide mutase [Nitrospirota bacterium]